MPSIVILRLTDMTPALVNDSLRVVLDDAARSLKGGTLVTVTDAGIRIRKLPIDAG